MYVSWRKSSDLEKQKTGRVSRLGAKVEFRALVQGVCGGL